MNKSLLFLLHTNSENVSVVHAQIQRVKRLKTSFDIINEKEN